MHSPLPMARQKQESIKACYPWPTEINKLFQHLVRTLKSDSELSFTCVALFFFLYYAYVLDGTLLAHLEILRHVN